MAFGLGTIILLTPLANLSPIFPFIGKRPLRIGQQFLSCFMFVINKCIIQNILVDMQLK